MTDEAQIRSSLQIDKTTSNVKVLEYRSNPSAFRATVTGTKGPTPGAITVSTAGTSIDLSALTTPGLCRIMNMSAVNYVQVGIWDATGVIFYPMLELLPGESFIVRLSRDIQDETGTGDPGTTVLFSDNKLRLKAISAACVCLVEAFEK